MTTTASPVVVDRGPGDPAIAIVGGIHGDEPSGVHAIRNLLDMDLTFQKGVRFILGNPPAFVANQRYLDVDLNRTFPGDPEAPERERRLAASLCELTSGIPTLSLHSTHSHPDPIALVSFDDEVADIATSLPITNIVDETTLIDGSHTECSSVITVEAGCQETTEAIDTATEQANAFLAVNDVLDEDVPSVKKTFYKLSERVSKPPDESYALHVENFEQVNQGTIYATAGEQEYEADQQFTPILMSECGYDDVFGYKGIMVGDSLEEARNKQ
ncbi:MAG: succinylglutamate desuccinylase/aspartoacylase family protein [Halobacteriaceae archaeon]